MKQNLFRLRSIFDSVATCSLLLTLVLLIGIGLLSYNSTQRFLDNDGRMVRTYQVINGLNSVLSDLRDAETGQRGYLITGDAAYLQPYHVGRSKVKRDLAAVRPLLENDTVQLKRLDAVQILSQQKIAELDRTVALRRNAGALAAQAAVETGQGKALMDRARETVGQMQWDEQRLLLERTAMAEREGVAARIWGSLGSLIAAVLVTIAIGFVTLYLRQRAAIEAENLKLAEAARDAAVQQRIFLKDVLASVTEGRLALCDREEDLPAELAVVGDTIPLTRETGPRALRNAAVQAARACNFDEERVHDLATSVSEAGMNAIVHGGGGTAVVRTDGSEWVQIWVVDHGKGIALDALPQSTLDRGYSSAGSLGHGFWLMLQMCHRVSLLTGSKGTTVVLEQSRQPQQAPWMLQGGRATALTFTTAAHTGGESDSTPKVDNRAFRTRAF